MNEQGEAGLYKNMDPCNQDALQAAQYSWKLCLEPVMQSHSKLKALWYMYSLCRHYYFIIEPFNMLSILM